jgi:hypothetical protein
MCVTELQTYPYPSMKNIPQWMPKHETLVALLDMMPRSVEGWRDIIA